MQAVKKKEPIEEAEPLSCIFGKEISNACLVRTEIANRSRSGISKYVKPVRKNSDLAEEMDSVLDTVSDALLADMHTLSDFCTLCPHLAIFIGKLEEKK